jgi:hypothetical protein
MSLLLLIYLTMGLAFLWSLCKAASEVSDERDS